jgi:hypothetical protein
VKLIKSKSMENKIDNEVNAIQSRRVEETYIE